MIKFLKMNGNGNDFVIIDRRTQPFEVTPPRAAWIAYRRFGIGCDQVILLDESKNADAFMTIYNADGTTTNACGNATRCIAHLIMGDTKKEARIETNAGILIGWRANKEEVTVNMGEPILDWRKIPLSSKQDIMHLPIEVGPLKNPTAVSMGNPHMVFFVPNVDDFKLRQYGWELEHHQLFPERANVSSVTVVNRNHLKMKVWERGVGKTLSCGTAACAALVAAQLHDFTDKKATIEQPGGYLTVEWHDNGNIYMTGKVYKSFEGAFEPQEMHKKAKSAD